MRLSVFTPSHDPRYLDDCYASLVRQTHPDWEWIVLLNGRCPAWAPPAEDARVRVARGRDLRGVGAVKAAACEAAGGEILVELDHDDILLEDCLAEVDAAFAANPRATLVYSDFAQINEDRSPNDERFNPAMGWVYSPEEHDGVLYSRCHALAPYPHNVGYIWYAPNHVRAFRAQAYRAAGGYDRTLEVLDDQELMMRLFRAGDFVHVDRLLYLQRVHPTSTQRLPEVNPHIQEQTVAYYREHATELQAAWCRRRGLRILGLRTPTSPELSVMDGEEVLVLDPEHPAIDAADDSVGLVRAIELLQRIPDGAALFNEIGRVGVHGAMVATSTPSTDGRGAFQDPSHVAFYNENSFWYFTQAARRASVPTLRARLQVGVIGTVFPNEFFAAAQIPFVEANLLVVKDGARLGGPLLC